MLLLLLSPRGVAATWTRKGASPANYRDVDAARGAETGSVLARKRRNLGKTRADFALWPTTTTLNARNSQVP
jgi:hypothetical protein